ncbi:MAG: prohibitin family protein [Nanoarchaeota archaeon]
MSYINEKGEPNVNKIVKHLILGLVGLIVLFGSFGIVDAGERGVKTRLGAVVGIIPQGLYFKLPIIENVVKLEVKTRTVNYDRNGNEGDSKDSSALSGASRDLQDVQIGVVVTYHINPEKVDSIFVQYKSVDSYESTVIEPAIRETVKSTSAHYTAEELVTKRAEYSEKVNQLLTERFGLKDSILETFSVTNFEFSHAFTQAIEAKVTATQNAEAAKNKLEQIKYEAEQRIVQARGEAEAIRIQAQAIQSQGGAEYVNLKAVEKWNGALPTYMMGNSVPFINIK